MLLANRFAPITFQFGFIRGDLRRVAEHYVRWQHMILKIVTQDPVSGTLASKLEKILPVDEDGQRILLTATQSDWVAVFDNRVKGGTSDGIVGVVSERLATGGLVVCDIPNTFRKSNPPGFRGLWGATAISAYGKSDSGIWGFTRAVSVRNDVSGWRFHQMGPPWDFEDLERYQARIIRQRLDSTLLAMYCEKLGIRLFDESFYEGPGLAMRSKFPMVPGPRTYDLDELQRQIGLGAPRGARQQ